MATDINVSGKFAKTEILAKLWNERIAFDAKRLGATMRICTWWQN